MPLQYTNRKGDTYHLQTKAGKNGKPAYSFSRKVSGAPADNIPDGYEIFESPDTAQVLLRKKKPTQILPIELQLLEAKIRTLANLEHFLVDTIGDSLVVYVADNDADEFVSRMDFIIPMHPAARERAKQHLMRNARYTKMMRFCLIDPQTRQFSVDRWCFLGSIDNWFPLAYGKPLADLIKKYVPHLGKESFYELM